MCGLKLSGGEKQRVAIAQSVMCVDCVVWSVISHQSCVGSLIGVLKSIGVGKRKCGGEICVSSVKRSFRSGVCGEGICA